MHLTPDGSIEGSNQQLGAPSNPMEVLIYLVPLALGLGLLGLGAFLWSLKTGQYDDLEGAAWRALMDDDRPAGKG